MKIQGLFWEVEPAKSNEKKSPPVFTRDMSIQAVAEAIAFDVPLMSEFELEAARLARVPLVCDIEIYPNYFLCAFKSTATGKAYYIESVPCEAWEFSPMDLDKLRKILLGFPIVTFNGNAFDMPILALAVEGKTVPELKAACDMLIQSEVFPWQLLKNFKCEELEANHIDLIEVLPLSANLKIYGGRIHTRKMQDFPFLPETILSPEQIAIVRFYCINDLNITLDLFHELREQLQIRCDMSARYGIDLRSKSDAQIAEAVIKSELERMSGIEPKRPEILPGTAYFYQVPAFLTYKTEEMRAALERIRTARFIVGESGAVSMPDELEGFEIKIGKGVYRMGIGGLHSSEKNVSHKASPEFALVDRDVASYYPAIILNQMLCPLHLGFDFITVYKSLVERRLAAKRSGDKVQADMLKIVINGSFGKFGSKYSALYAPNLLIQVTISGQLALLMLIESLEMSGVQVCSANTDGIVLKYPRVMGSLVESIVAEWERQTNFETEATDYAAIYCRDVNNYIAVKPDGKTKTKGAYSNPWNDPKLASFRFHKNPTNIICIEAVTEYLTKGTPIAETVRGCRDIRKFLTVRTVKGGAVKDGVFLGKAVRWYYAEGAGGEMVYASSGNAVPLSYGARACLELPEEFPADVDFSKYEGDSLEILREIAAL